MIRSYKLCQSAVFIALYGVWKTIHSYSDSIGSDHAFIVIKLATCMQRKTV